MVILMYHAFGRSTEPASRYVVPAQRFAEQMAMLKWMRYEVLGLETFLERRRTGQPSNGRCAAITIDDGYADNHAIAFSILQRFGFPATIFLVSGRIGRVTDWTREPSLARREMLSWAHVREMQDGGVEFGAHTRTHPRLSQLSEDAARSEIAGSGTDVADATGRPVRSFAYPYGDCNAVTQAIAADAGFWGSCGTQTGKNTPDTPLHNLRRTEIFGTDSRIEFTLKLQSGRRDVLWLGRRGKSEGVRHDA
jgi:peptidoglycan/xylan/chitin deacetylase (PgdA/CDA1 family)